VKVQKKVAVVNAKLLANLLARLVVVSLTNSAKKKKANNFYKARLIPPFTGGIFM
jgi:hypothetical protein